MAEPFGQYELLKRLGGGGMGEVFLARQRGAQGFEKLLVLKTLHPHLADDEPLKTMFLDEARLAAALLHPNICQILDLGEVEGTLYMAMEYIAGDELRAIAASARKLKRPMPPPLVARIVADAAEGLHFAHTARDAGGRPLHIIHRDVSPQNILVTYEGGVKVIDFGVAKAAGRATRTQTGTLKGKYAYMAPEQVEGRKDLDARADVFALGIVLWETLTGRRLFKGESDVQTLALVAGAQADPPSTVEAGISPELDAIALKALEKDRDRRYASAEDLQWALEGWITATRSPAARPHLAAFVREVYAERWEQYRRRGPLADLPPADQPVRGHRTPTPAPRPAAVAEPAPSGSGEPSRTAALPRPASHFALAAAGLTAGALAVAAAVLILVNRGPALPAPAPAPAPPAAESLPSPPAAAPAEPAPVPAPPPPEQRALPEAAPPPRAAEPAAGAPRALIDLNRATEAELQALPGIGDVKARAIIEWRTQNGPFTSVDQLDAVKGIGPKILERLRPLVTVAAPAQPSSPAQGKN